MAAPGEKYDVFLSFRGPDTRESFADCLFEFLQDAGLRVFMDDEELRVGESIAWGIQKAIYDSKLFVPIFSKGYASSKWCLNEIAWMEGCLEEFPGKKEMLPVFYDVDASDVKLKTDLYTEALLEHQKTSDRETVGKWRKALIKVPEVKGWNRRDAKGQGKLIRRIVQDISHRLKLKHRILPDHFIGIEEQVQYVMNALDYGSRDVRIVVIHGMGGIGKTTLASAVFNKICWQYQGCSFLSNVRESAAGNGILNLQDKLMRDTVTFSSSNFCDVNDAMNRIQGSLRNKDVLVVLDDVSDMDQIKKLVGMGDWVGLGSRVIITTRNLRCVANVEEIENNVTILRGKKMFIYQMRELSFNNSLQLLCRHAFCQHVPPHGYEQLSYEIISFTRGVPLAIEVIGSYLRRKSARIWKEMLNKLKKVPHARLYQEILMSSYETLSDEEKEIFLDIAFFFTGGLDKTNAFYYWEACGLYPEMSVDTLISNALVKINCRVEFWMHDLLKDLGRELVRKQSNGNLGMCSRLCNEDAKSLLLKREGTKHVKALKLDSTHAYNFTPAELSGLSGLRFLELCGGNFVGDFGDCCLSELRWVSWRDCPLDFHGANFYLENLVVLKLSESNITDSWSGWEQFKTARNLKVLELQRLNLTTTPDLSSFLNLERLTFREWDCLVHINPSIGNLESLKSLEMMNCVDLKHFGTRNQSRQVVLQLPSSICNLKALSRLEIHLIKLNELPENIGELKGLKSMAITECEFLRTLPDSIGDLKSLIHLFLMGDGIIELPESIGKLRNLITLNVSSNRLRRLPATIGDLDRLKELDVSDNRDLHGEIPDEFGKLQSLRYLNLSLTGIRGLPSSIVQPSLLTLLELMYCPELHRLPDLPISLIDLYISSYIDDFKKLGDLTSDPPPMLAPYLSTEFVHIDPSISNTECVNSLEMINHPLSPSDNSPGESRQVVFQLPSSICNLKALSTLKIHRIKLNQLPENIGELKALQFMEITGCKFLRILPDSIGDLESLMDLSLSDDGIIELPESIGKLRNLITLNVSSNRLRRLPAKIGDLDRLKVLIACYNEELQGEIPDEFGKLQSLTSLNLSQTGICGLPSSIVLLSRLKSLKLRNCPELHRLPDLPMCLTDLNISSTEDDFQKLEDLTADPLPMPAPYLSTEFVHMDPSISNTECVNSLEMINHPLSPSDNSPGESRQVVLQLPSSICNLKALSTLEIHRIKLNQLPGNIGELKALKFMAITGCKFLRILPDSIGDLESLMDLSLIGDGIIELPESIGKLRNLNSLNVSNNRLRRLPKTIGDLDRLRVLDVSDNRDLHGEIPDEFGKLQSLTSLNLSRTGIRGLPSSIVQLAHLKSLKLRNCPELHGLPDLPMCLTDLDISCTSQF